MKHQELIFLLILLFVAGYVRYTYLFAESVWVDETVYMWQGYRLLHSPMLLFSPDYYGNTLFPLIILAFFNIFTSDRFVAGRLAGYFFSLVGIFFTYLVGKELKDEYVGFLAALLVSVNPLHWFLGSRTLIDLPEATMVTVTAYCFLRYERQRTLQNFLLLFAAGIATIFTKIPGALVLPGIMLYYTLRAGSSPSRTLYYFSAMKNQKTITALALGGVGIFVWSKFPFITGMVQSLEPRLIFMYQLPFMFTSTILVFLVLGVIFSLFYRKWDALGVLCMFISFLAAFSLLPAEPDPRHLAPLLPLGIILATFGYFEVSELVKLFFPIRFLEWGVLLLGALFLFPLFTMGNEFIAQKSYTFTGYNEAGEWLAQNLPEGALAYVSSQGPIRLFSGFGYNSEGGPLRQIQTFGEGAEPDFSQAATPIFLHIDMWERGPQWSFPFTEEKLRKLEAQGFRVEKVVFRKYPTQQGSQDMPVHFLLVKRN